jgi:NurA-like 5'-3' nuclease
MNPSSGDFIVDVYGHKGVIASVYYDYVRLTDGKHVYKLAIAKIVTE